MESHNKKPSDKLTANKLSMRPQAGSEAITNSPPSGWGKVPKADTNPLQDGVPPGCGGSKVRGNVNRG